MTTSSHNTTISAPLAEPGEAHQRADLRTRISTQQEAPKKPKHADAREVCAQLKNPDRIALGTTPYALLPRYAKLAIERLDRDNELRTGDFLDMLLQGYANATAEHVWLEACAATHHICRRRFWDYEPATGLETL